MNRLSEGMLQLAAEAAQDSRRAGGQSAAARGVGTVVVVGPQAVDAEVVPARARARGYARVGGAGPHAEAVLDLAHPVGWYLQCLWSQ